MSEDKEGIVNNAFLEMEELEPPFGSGLIVHQESVEGSNVIEQTAEMFGKSALPVTIGPKDPSEYLLPLANHSQFDIVETIDAQPRPDSFTRSFQINGEDLGALFSLNLTTIYKCSPRSRILVNLRDRAGDCIAVFRGPEGTQGCVCCCTRCAEGRMKRRRNAGTTNGTVFLNPQESMTVESPPGSVIGHIALHHDFYGIYNKGMLSLLYSVPFKDDSGIHHINAVDSGCATREPGRISRGEWQNLKINVRPPTLVQSTQHKLLFLATALCMFGMDTDRIPRPCEWIGCLRLRNAIEYGCCQ